MGTHSIDMEHGGDDANRRLVRFFSICLGSLALVYSLLSLRLFLEGETLAIADFASAVNGSPAVTEATALVASSAHNSVLLVRSMS